MTEVVDFATPLLEALIPKLETLAWDCTRARIPTIEAVAEMMVASLPTGLITAPAIGPCCTARGLATWRGVSRQAALHLYRAGRTLGFKHDGVLVYPAMQFGATGRALPVMRGLLEKTTVALADAAQVANGFEHPTLRRDFDRRTCSRQAGCLMPPPD